MFLSLRVVRGSCSVRGIFFPLSPSGEGQLFCLSEWWGAVFLSFGVVIGSVSVSPSGEGQFFCHRSGAGSVLCVSPSGERQFFFCLSEWWGGSVSVSPSGKGQFFSLSLVARGSCSVSPRDEGQFFCHSEWWGGSFFLSFQVVRGSFSVFPSGEGQFFSPSESTLVETCSCLTPFRVCGTYPNLCPFDRFHIQLSRTSIALTARGGMETRKHCTQVKTVLGNAIRLWRFAFPGESSSNFPCIVLG